MEHARPPAELNMDGGPVSRANAWKKWRQQFMLFVKASGVHSEPSSVQASLLINLIGPDGFDIYQAFTFETEAEKDDVQTVIKKFDSYFGTKVNKTLIRYKFFTRNQEDGESIQQYVTALRLLSKDCEFSSLEDDLIKDRIVCGIRNSTLRDRLLRSEDLNLDKAMKICQAEELSQESGSQLSGNSAVQVNAVEQRGAYSRRGMQNLTGVGAGPSRAGASNRGRGPFVAAAARGERRGVTRPIAAPCRRCGGARCISGDGCPAQVVDCFVCGKRGHFARTCKSKFTFKSNERVKRVYDIEDYQSSDSECERFYVSVIKGRKNSSDEWCEKLLCGNREEKFKLDTGADINVMSLETFLLLGFNLEMLKPDRIKLESYSGNFIPIKGVCYLQCVYKSQTFNLKFAIADMSCQSVLGRKSCEELGLVRRIHSVKLLEFKDLFTGLGCLPGKYHIVIDESVRPVVCAARKVPLGLRDRLAEELKKMESLGVIRKVTHPTPWVHPLVIAAKKNNGIRICLDPRELNRAVQRAHFQLPTVTELAAKLHGARVFSVLDANSGFWTVSLDEASADLCTFATPFGRYQFLRLPFGISCASEVFHSKMRQLLEGLEGVDNFVDDIICWGKDRQEHDRRLDNLLKRAREINLKFNKDKCKIAVKQVTYLGHVFDAEGMRPDYNKIKAIKEMPVPKDKKSLERFLGVINYLSKFIRNYSESAIPLTTLLKKDSEWQWEESAQQAFETLKQRVCSAPVLALYDVSKPVVLSVDASRDALGAVLMQGGRPVEYASRTLTDAQRRYAQIEKELLAIVFACERFHQYVFGKKEILVESDHKPLESIFKKPLMSVPARLQRMMLRIQGYDLVVSYKPGKYMYIPDALSRAPLPELYSEEVHENVLYQIQMIINNLPMSKNKLELIKKEITRDLGLKEVLNCIKYGWPDHKCKLQNNIREFWSMKDELFEVDDVIFKDNLVLIPKSLRRIMLNIVHEGHLGIDRCKRRARQVMFWPNMSSDIENYVKQCRVCQESLNAPAREPLISIDIPELPWNKVGSDIFEFQKKYFLIIVDYYSNFIEVIKLNNLTSTAVIQSMKEVFSRHGIPETLISDNGTQYSSRDFKFFSDEWGFTHVTSSPHYPQANGKSERAVQTIKKLLIKSVKSGGDFYLALLNYRNTPREGLSSPAQLLMSRRLRCKLPVNSKLLVPKPVEVSEHCKLLEKQSMSSYYYNQNCKKLPDLEKGDDVICIEGKQRSRGTVVGVANTPRSYIIQNRLGNRYRRNRRHLIKCQLGDSDQMNNAPESDSVFRKKYMEASEEISLSEEPIPKQSKKPQYEINRPISPPLTRRRARAKQATEGPVPQ
ncbi:uncharacterized protein K02A2.6-like [Amyelois transitella]|uniref:uncharacterized protein K02A2.6-like n=1 Tax=Amyelois transitella TaxID=680683 RepID=UPI0029905B0A|nr:uncharacterized protein K02A2.6-like [Amyelois transitella]